MWYTSITCTKVFKTNYKSNHNVFNTEQGHRTLFCIFGHYNFHCSPVKVQCSFSAMHYSWSRSCALKGTLRCLKKNWVESSILYFQIHWTRKLTRNLAQLSQKCVNSKKRQLRTKPLLCSDLVIGGACSGIIIGIFQKQFFLSKWRYFKLYNFFKWEPSTEWPAALEWWKCAS